MLTAPDLRCPRSCKHRIVLVPTALEIMTHRKQVATFVTNTVPRAAVRLPLPATSTRRYLATVIPALTALPFQLDVEIALHGWSSSRQLLDDFALAVDQLASGGEDAVQLAGSENHIGFFAPKALASLHEHFLTWLATPNALKVEVALQADQPIPHALTQIIGNDLLQGRSFGTCKADSKPALAPHDLSAHLLVNTPVPPWFPEPSALDAQGFPRHFPMARFNVPAKRLVLGDIPMPFSDQEVRFSVGDRALHCYVIGATGTGKSTLLRNMIVQDLDEGHGVGLLDPHGDLISQLLPLIPPRRRIDVVLIDFTDTDNPVGINFLEHKGPNAEIQRGYIVQDLLDVLWRLFSYNPDAFGPMFEIYMRNALLLLMSDPKADATLLDLPRVFGDETYRKYLISSCADSSVREFWTEIAEAARGDAGLSNIAPYIISKLTPFTENKLVQQVVGQSKSTVDFRKIMDGRKILLVNLSKGLLNERDTNFLGMLVTSRIFAAAMSRADMQPRRRAPFFTYIDEFQNFTSGSVSPILAEARKYGLYLTLAHQNLAQLPSDLGQAVLANTGSKIIMRVGVPDANALAQYVSPRFSEPDLIALPDGHALARLQVFNTPTPPFLLRTRASHGVALISDAAVTDEDEVASASKSKYSRPHRQVAAEIELRRLSYLIRIPGLFNSFNKSFREYLAEEGIGSIADLLSVLPDRYEELGNREAAMNANTIDLLKKLNRLATARLT